MNVSSIYKITNTVTEQLYIGFTTKTVKQRFDAHKRSSRVKRHQHFPIYVAMHRYGVENFTIETIYQSWDREHCLEMEAFFIDKFNTLETGYNYTPGGLGFGRPHTQETCEKLSSIHKGRPRSAEHNRKIAEALRGKTKSTEHIEALKSSFALNPRRRGNLSDEGRAKLSKQMKERWAATSDRTPSEEARRKMSLAAKGRVFTPEHRARIAESRRKYFAERKQT